MEQKHPVIIAAWIAFIGTLITVFANLAVPFIENEFKSGQPETPLNTILPEVQHPTPIETPVVDPIPTGSLAFLVTQYIVDNGDSMPIVSRNIFGVDSYSTAIGRANCTGILHTGDILTINYYVVQNGDYLYLIAERYGTSVDRLQHINGLSDEIYPNQIVILPTYEQCK